jgi:hypothetical protein
MPWHPRERLGWLWFFYNAKWIAPNQISGQDWGIMDPFPILSVVSGQLQAAIMESDGDGRGAQDQGSGGS